MAAGLGTVLGCRETSEPILGELNETFDRNEIGSGWRDSGGGYRIVNGELAVRNARHHPLWLRKRLPVDVSIEFDARTDGNDGDIRVVLFGDGKSANPDAEGCQSSGYELVFGGWKNSLSVLCRTGQADGGHKNARSDWPIVPGRAYHVYITRKDGVLAWYVGGHDMMAWNDPQPLSGPGHDAFGFDGGQSEVFFDNLVIGPYHP